MFAASAFESPESVEFEAFQNRQEIRMTRFETVRTLYVSGCEDDRISNLQTVLLMTLWDCSSDDGPSASKYISIAKAILESIEMAPTESETRMMKENPAFWKRLQWCVYIRDRLTALTLQCPYQIDESKFNVPMLKAADLQIGPLSTKSCLGTNGSHPAIRDPSMRALLSQIPIHLALFCKWATPILSSQSIGAQSIQHWMYLRTGLEVLLRDSELKEWQNTLPKALKWIHSSPLTGINKHGDVVLFFRAMLNGLYHLACHGLHKSRVDMVDPGLPELADLSKQQMRSSISEMTEIYRFFRSKSFVYELPDVQVAMLETCIASNLSDFSSPIPFIRQSAIEAFQLCAQGLQQMSDTYPSASKALATVNARIIARADKNKNKELEDPQIEWQGPHIGKYRGHHSPVTDWLDKTGMTTSQQIDRFDITETSALLTSHFMMTSSERNFLQDLSSPETASPDSAAEVFVNSQEPKDGVWTSKSTSPDWKDSVLWSLYPAYGLGGLID
ncbi:hypothetical protein N7462_006612 [Penicillium macrosclerotiorum]|uniref:uncharacterized protein n=1 Tax=Penicillium macrosclerotiorum TaxID=303699 RepID=UPI002547C4F4|nr:uncharacterized protein N7462_006612 [Penicillium macrosclerotiorum]KAJ5683447.1 hypothetical protein N7462_006612 [Penicillium macrosclerotiorum]